MTKHILTTPVELFRGYMARQSFSELKRLKRDIREFKWDRRGKLSDDQILDIERKETIIDFFIQRRIDLNEPGVAKDHADWERKINFKRKYH